MTNLRKAQMERLQLTLGTKIRIRYRLGNIQSVPDPNPVYPLILTLSQQSLQYAGLPSAASSIFVPLAYA